MGAPNKILAGMSASLYMQPTSSPTPLTLAQLSTYASVSAIAVSANQLNVEAIPPYGQDDAVASFTIAGSRQSDKIPVQAAPTSMTITAPWNPSDANLLLIEGDSASGSVERTYVVAATDGTNVAYYAFNARVSEFKVDQQPSAESKCVFTLHPRGNMFGRSNNP